MKRKTLKSKQHLHLLHMRNFKKIEQCGCHYIQIIAKENDCKLGIAALKLFTDYTEHLYSLNALSVYKDTSACSIYAKGPYKCIA